MSKASFPIRASRRTSSFDNIAFVATTPRVVLAAADDPSCSTRSSRRSLGSSSWTQEDRSVLVHDLTDGVHDHERANDELAVTHRPGPHPPGIARSGPQSFATVAPVPTPTRPSTDVGGCGDAGGVALVRARSSRRIADTEVEDHRGGHGRDAHRTDLAPDPSRSSR